MASVAIFMFCSLVCSSGMFFALCLMDVDVLESTCWKFSIEPNNTVKTYCDIA